MAPASTASPGTDASAIAHDATAPSAAKTKSTATSKKADAKKKLKAKTARTKAKRPDDKPKLGMLDMVRYVASDCDVTQRVARSMIDTFIETVMKAVSEDRRVVIPGFGTWLRRHKKARTGINPKNKEPIRIEEHGAVGFKPGTQFRSRVKDDPSAQADDDLEAQLLSTA